MKFKPTEPGHMKDSGPNLKQSDQVRQSLSRARTRNESMKRWKPVELNWRQK